ncbi:TrkH family potassium uptake protein [Altericroceibacterium xinjiangense]|uniref:TrkH family potassium uptake protein n=1 Tax=Altericroceibacterium xinjiangense TaxID=762261 RepID=UPI000F7F9216|nr:potassium transporter TrkG [Altericroceibacterium xinjiangense]
MKSSVLRHPVRVVPLLFLATIAIGTVLLLLPVSRAGPGSASLLDAVFTATSAVAVTGLATVDTATYWSFFGQAVILLLLQIGGFGIMTGAVVLGLVAGRDFRLRDRLATEVERNRLLGSSARSVLYLAFTVTLVVEAGIALVLILRLRLAHGESWGQAVWNGVFHSVSAFNNAGFSTYSDSVMGFQADFWILGPIMFAVVLSSLGFPVIQELRNRPFAFRSWSLHSKITFLGTLFLLAAGFVGVLAAEWSNPATLGPMPWSAKTLNAAFHSVMPRTAGFNSLNVGDFRVETLGINYVLMFIGGGSAGTAGGIKITTVFLLLLIVWAEIRGQQDTNVMGRRVGSRVERQALAVGVLAGVLIAVATLVLVSISHMPMQDILFEAISAFSTVGLSTGITADLPPAGQVVLIVLMYLGRVGTITVATALALQHNQKRYRYPEENPIVG